MSATLNNIGKIEKININQKITLPSFESLLMTLNKSYCGEYSAIISWIFIILKKVYLNILRYIILLLIVKKHFHFSAYTISTNIPYIFFLFLPCLIFLKYSLAKWSKQRCELRNTWTKRGFCAAEWDNGFLLLII